MSLSKSLLRPEVVEQIKTIGRADLLVGIPSYRNADTIKYVIQTVGRGLAKYFPDLRAVIVNSDGGSDDDTRHVASEAPVPAGIAKIVTEYNGSPGKGTAFLTIFEIADRLGAQTCLVFDSDLRSITPEWVKLLGEPVHKHNYGFVAPFYARHRFDGTITNSIAHPLMCALYGQGIRQPIGGEFALSGGLAKILSHQNIWESDVARFGIDIWMTTTAVCEGFRVCQADMGAKLHDEKDPGADLGPMFTQVVGTIFELMGKYQTKWQAINGCRSVQLLGEHPKQTPDPIEVDVSRLLGRFHRDLVLHKALLPEIVSADSWNTLKRLAVSANGEAVPFPDKLWARVVYDHAIAYNFSSDIDRAEVLSSMMALYFGRTADFVQKTLKMTEAEVEETVYGAAEAFTVEKPYLLERWRDRAPVFSR